MLKRRAERVQGTLPELAGKLYDLAAGAEAISNDMTDSKADRQMKQPQRQRQIQIATMMTTEISGVMRRAKAISLQ